MRGVARGRGGGGHGRRAGVEHALFNLTKVDLVQDVFKPGGGVVVHVERP